MSFVSLTRCLTFKAITIFKIGFNSRWEALSFLAVSGTWAFTKYSQAWYSVLCTWAIDGGVREKRRWIPAPANFRHEIIPAVVRRLPLRKRLFKASQCQPPCRGEYPCRYFNHDLAPASAAICKHTRTECHHCGVMGRSGNWSTRQPDMHYTRYVVWPPRSGKKMSHRFRSLDKYLNQSIKGNASHLQIRACCV